MHFHATTAQLPPAPNNRITTAPLLHRKTSYNLVHLHVPLVAVLQVLGPLLIVNALVLGHNLEHVLNAWHHTLEAAEVDVSALRTGGGNCQA